MGGSGQFAAEAATVRIRGAFQDCSGNAEAGSTARVVRQSRLCDIARSLAVHRWMFETL